MPIKKGINKNQGHNLVVVTCASQVEFIVAMSPRFGLAYEKCPPAESWSGLVWSMPGRTQGNRGLEEPAKEAPSLTIIPSKSRSSIECLDRGLIITIAAAGATFVSRVSITMSSPLSPVRVSAAFIATTAVTLAFCTP